MQIYNILTNIFDDIKENWKKRNKEGITNYTVVVVNFLILLLTLLIIMWFGLYLWNQGIQPVFPGVVAPIPDYFSLFKFVAALVVFA